MRRSRRITVFAVVAVFAVGLVAVAVERRHDPAREATEPAAAGPTPRGEATSRPDVVSARALARHTNARVEIAELTGTTSQTWANPDGTLTTELTTEPVRGKTTDGWRPTDNTLRAGTGGFVPTVGSVDVRVSDGGDTEVASLANGPWRFTLGWPRALPRPQVIGGIATYRDVLPAADLVVAVGNSGFDQSLVLRARPDKPLTIRYPLRLDGVSVAVDADGGMVLRDAAGATVASATPPLMWGAGTDPDTGEPLRSAPVSTRLVTEAGGPVLELRPDPAFLADPAVTYPVVVDPSVTVTRANYAYMDSVNDDTAFFNSTEDARVGTHDGTQKIRSLFSFNVGGLRGATILNAEFVARETWAYSCTATAVQFWEVAPFGSNATWNRQPAAIRQWDSKTVAYGRPGCPARDVPFTATGLVQQWATAQADTGHVMLKAGDESKTNFWKRFANTPRLVVDYTFAPGVDSPQPADNTFVNSTEPTLAARYVDRDGVQGRAEFEVYDGANTLIAGGTGGTVAAGSYSQWRVPAGKLAGGARYTWRVRGAKTDGTTTTWTTPIAFTVDNTPPTAPVVTSTSHPSADAWYTTNALTAGWAAPADSGSGLAGYGVVLDDRPGTVPSKVTQTTTTFSKTVPDGITYLHVSAQDKAGGWSPTTHYRINVKGAIPSLDQGGRTQRYLALQAAGPTARTQVTFQYRRGDSETWKNIPLAGGNMVNTTTGQPVTAWPVPLHSGTSAMLRWDVPATSGTTTDGPIQVRPSFDNGALFGETKHATLDIDGLDSDYAYEQVGPGSLNLGTGNYVIGVTDVAVDTIGADLQVARSFNSRLPGQAGIFGPGWTGSVVVGDSDYVSAVDNGSYVLVHREDGAKISFTRPTSGSVYISPLNARDLTLTAATGGFDLVDNDGTKVTFTKLSGTVTYLPASVLEAGDLNAVTVTYEVADGVARVKRALGPVPAGVTCGATLVAGCRAIEFDYAGATTATGTDEAKWGDAKGRVKRVRLTAYDPAAGQMRTVDVASYLYDSTGRLRVAWDPRISPALKERYTYDAGGRLASVTPPGQEPYTLAYTAVSGDVNAGRLTSVSRVMPGAGTSTVTVAYRVPVTGTGTPYPMGTADVAAWGQTDAPVDATAVFPPDAVPSAPPTNWQRATVHYLNRDGREVNVAEPGGHITTTEYDRHGNVVRELSAANRARAMAAGATTALRSARARELDTRTVYDANGIVPVEELGPTHLVQLDSGALAAAREHTVWQYDQGAPAGGPFHLETTETTGAWLPGTAADADVRTNSTAYDGQGGLGWRLRTPTMSITDPAGLNLRSVTLYDPATGSITERRTPAGVNGGDARSSRVVYYTAGQNPQDAACGNRPEYADLPCKASPAAQPGTAGLPDLPVTHAVSYDMLFNLTRADETVGTVTRTGTAAYDAAGRAMETLVSSPVGADEPRMTTGYDPVTGLVAMSTAVDGSGTSVVTRDFDSVGRVTGYHDADGNHANIAYDLLGRPTLRSDGKGSQTYVYDTTVDPRGLLTSVRDSAAGTFTARYDADGNQVVRGLPNGVQALSTVNEVGAVTDLRYARTVGCSGDACTWLQFTSVESIDGLARTRGGTLSGQVYRYDQAGRLVEVRDTAPGQGCVIRAYAYDANSNRTGRTTKAANPDGSCNPGAAGSTVTHTYDTGDRLIDAGFTYDAFGRVTAVPAGVGGTAFTASYYANDTVHSLSQNGRTRTWTMDPIGRLRARTTSGPPTEVRINHYADDGDSPAWIAENANGSRWTRNITGVDGGLAAVQDSQNGVVLHLSNLHGDIVATASLDPAVAAPLSTFDSTEFGAPRQGGAQRYGWHGAAMREADDVTGVILMGARLYLPSLGRFLQVDPIAGGSANSYDYANQDPVNQSDLDGRIPDWAKIIIGGAIGAAVQTTICRFNPTFAAICGIVVGAVGYALTYWWVNDDPDIKGALIAGAVGAVLGAIGLVKAGATSATAGRKGTHIRKGWRKPTVGNPARKANGKHVKKSKPKKLTTEKKMKKVYKAPKKTYASLARTAVSNVGRAIGAGMGRRRNL